MGKDEAILEPQKMYDSFLKQNHEVNSQNFIDDLIKKANVNIADNRINAKKIDKETKSLNEIKSTRKKTKLLGIFCIVISVIALLVGLVYISLNFIDDYEMIVSKTLLILIPILSILLGTTLLLVYFLVIRKKTKKLDSNILYLEDKINKLKEIGYDQLKPLNDLFDFGMSSEIINKTSPLIQIDKYFDNKKWSYLKTHYGFEENNDKDSSIIFLLSGSIVGNPFLIKRTKEMTILKHKYTGSLTISYTETYTDSEGNTRTTTTTETLYASILKPKPFYDNRTVLIYANDAAPDLSFSRRKTVPIDADEKDIERMVNKGEKKLNKMHDKAVLSNSNFTPLGNIEFDYLFNALNRDNETQFRLLFTPLAQINILNLIKSKEPYGDDFMFIKNKKINTIISNHSNAFLYEDYPERFMHYDIDYIRKNFIDYQTKYYQSIFFDLAPLISIPLYQQNKPFEYIYKDLELSNYPSYEYEALANNFDANLIQNEEAITENIIKTKFLKKDGDLDRVELTAHAFKGIHRIEYVSVMGGDGNFHNVPVEWIEYIPVRQISTMEMNTFDNKRSSLLAKLNEENVLNTLNKYMENNYNISLKTGLIGFLLKNPKTEINEKEFENIFTK